MTRRDIDVDSARLAPVGPVLRSERGADSAWQGDADSAHDSASATAGS